jgi:hypothetical protein
MKTTDTTIRWDWIDLALRGAVPLAFDGAVTHLRRAGRALIDTRERPLVDHGLLLEAFADRIAADARVLRHMDPIFDAARAKQALARELPGSRREVKRWIELAAAAAEEAAADATTHRTFAVVDIALEAAVQTRIAANVTDAAQAAVRTVLS